MLLSLRQLKELLGLLDKGRQESTEPAIGYYCDRPNRSATGDDFRWEPKPNSTKQVGYCYPDGSVLETMSDGRHGIKVSLGVHGRAYLAIDPETGEVRCGACESVTDVGSEDSTELHEENT